jgi:hypothetical protein
MQNLLSTWIGMSLCTSARRYFCFDPHASTNKKGEEKIDLSIGHLTRAGWESAETLEEFVECEGFV